MMESSTEAELMSRRFPFEAASWSPDSPGTPLTKGNRKRGICRHRPSVSGAVSAKVSRRILKYLALELYR